MHLCFLSFFLLHINNIKASINSNPRITANTITAGKAANTDALIAAPIINPITTAKDTNKIIDVEPHNISGYYTLKTAHYSRLPVCSSCEYGPVCLKGCYGAQYEDSEEIFMPIPSVCNLFQQKIDHLMKLYYEYAY